MPHVQFGLEEMELGVLGVDNLKVFLGGLVLQHRSSSDADFDVSAFDGFEVRVSVLDFDVDLFVFKFLYFFLEKVPVVEELKRFLLCY